VSGEPSSRHQDRQERHEGRHEARHERRDERHEERRQRHEEHRARHQAWRDEHHATGAELDDRRARRRERRRADTRDEILIAAREVLLERGGERVFAVDVGRDQLHPKLRDDTRVVVLEGTDARHLNASIIKGPVRAIVADVSFISLTKALPAALHLAAPGAWLVALVKPQFEAGREAVGKGGVVRNAEARGKAVAEVRAFIERAPGWKVFAEMPSPILGGSGNEEVLIGAHHGA